MKRIVLATVAAAALALPAGAQQSGQSQPQQPQPHQSSSPHRGQMSGSQANNHQQPISVNDLSERQIRDLQQALNQKGVNAGNVDGKWGPETRSALEQFEQQQGFAAGRDQIDPRTVSALGLDASAFSGETTGSGSGSSGSGPSGSDSGSSPGMNGGSGSSTGGGSSNGMSGSSGSSGTGQPR